MTPEEALNLLDRVTSQISLNRADHVQIQRAVSTLAQLIGPQEEKEEKQPND